MIRPMIITTLTHPRLFKAFQKIDLDNGAINRVEPAREEYFTPEKWVHVIPEVEAALGLLTEDELEMLCSGEESERADLISGKGLVITDQLLSDYFESYSWNDILILKKGKKYLTRKQETAVIVSHVSPNVLALGAVDTETGYYAYGYIQLKHTKRFCVWKTESGVKIWSKAPKPNKDDLIEEVRETATI